MELEYTDDTTYWGTQKFTAIVRGQEITVELWLPLNLTHQDVNGISDGLRKLVKDS